MPSHLEEASDLARETLATLLERVGAWLILRAAAVRRTDEDEVEEVEIPPASAFRETQPRPRHGNPGFHGPTSGPVSGPLPGSAAARFAPVKRGW